jgi:hypothetical protein
MRYFFLRVVRGLILLVAFFSLLFSCASKQKDEGSITKEQDKSIAKNTDNKEDNDNIKPKFPGKVGGFSLQEGASLYDKETIFDLIDGGADVFLKQGFTFVFAGTYKSEGNVEIEAHLYYFDKETGAKNIFDTKQKDLPEAAQVVEKKNASALVSDLGKAVLILNVTGSSYPQGIALNELAQAIAKENNLKAVRTIIQYKK